MSCRKYSIGRKKCNTHTEIVCPADTVYTPKCMPIHRLKRSLRQLAEIQYVLMPPLI